MKKIILKTETTSVICEFKEKKNVVCCGDTSWSSFSFHSQLFLLDQPRLPCRDLATEGGGNNTGTDAGPRLLLNPLITKVSEVKNGRMRDGLYCKNAMFPCTVLAIGPNGAICDLR
jgi:hypothetical protein